MKVKQTSAEIHELCMACPVTTNLRPSDEQPNSRPGTGTYKVHRISQSVRKSHSVELRIVQGKMEVASFTSQREFHSSLVHDALGAS